MKIAKGGKGILWFFLSKLKACNDGITDLRVKLR
jgi:hypothetical protein